MERPLLRGGPYGTTTLTFLPLPRLDISASLLRGKWLRGADIRLLVPDDVDSLLRAQADEVRRCWAHSRAVPPAGPVPHGSNPHCSAARCSGPHGSDKDTPCE